MKTIFHYMKRYTALITLSIVLKFFGTIVELLLPYILEHLIDNVVPNGTLGMIFYWGFLMILTAGAACLFNIAANRVAVNNAHNVSYDIRRDLFIKTENLSGAQFDHFGLPSLISRMTSDSYNVQSFAQTFQTMCVRAPIQIIGGIAVTMTMDTALSGILCIMLPVLFAAVFFVSMKGIPLYYKVQEKLDDIVRVMRENITGIRVVKALSKSDYEMRRFAVINEDMTRRDITASTVMALPGPFMQICLNTGLALVIIVGARRVDAGIMKPGVILAFLTYFNMILMGAMGLNRIFMNISKASASANRMASVISADTDQRVLELAADEARKTDAFIRFEDVSFNYDAAEGGSEAFAGGQQEMCLSNISFDLKRGESLGIIGPTGCGKTTIINLLMRFYDVEHGHIYLDGRDVRSYEKDELHRRFGVVFQNDMVFHDTLRENISFGRDVSEADLEGAIGDAMAAEYIHALDEGLDYVAAIKGANLSGGQKQRLLIARALAAHPEILILDDSSSALDYKTDAMLRRAIHEHYTDTTTIMIAQRVSSVMNMTNILVLDDGHCIGYGSHAHLMETCEAYREIYNTQMGALG